MILASASQAGGRSTRVVGYRSRFEEKQYLINALTANGLNITAFILDHAFIRRRGRTVVSVTVLGYRSACLSASFD